MLAIICASAAFSTSLLSVLLWHHVARPRPFVARVQCASRPQWLLRWPIGPLAQWLAPLITVRCRVAVHTALERASLERTLTVEEWLALQALAATCLSAVCLLLADCSQRELLLRIGIATLVGVAAPWVWLRDRIARQQCAVLRELPNYLNLLTLGLEAGCAFGAALQIAVKRSPASPLRVALERALEEMRAGRSRAEALRRLEQRIGLAALGATVAAIVQAEATGVSLAPVMRAQAQRGTQERFARAEKLAMEAPVKMLAPLVLCIFPCTFIVIGFPIAVRLLGGL